MRIAELSRRTGMPMPTIKYYLREGLAHPGERLSVNQTSYDETHVRRLTLVRALIEVGGLSIAAAREVLRSLDSREALFTVLATMQNHLVTPVEQSAETVADKARDRVRTLVAGRGWHVDLDSPPATVLVDALATLDRLGHHDYATILDTLADAGQRVAEAEVGAVVGREDQDVVEAAVVGTALGGVVLNSLRLLAHQHASATAFGA
ncbi:MerR family transcriptional regulator [Saccharothrix violaceirubra]|uniref:DNA-binding transcriptional MerR regulator n=1 Tax=Saccharothrix violaceirubra TaxID=413306 RepID=A0A7W7WYA6_9PSEU|nr:MerR family transcriptional regulator [Saccharothrix violaceirubra]MBB4968012.1 DNA-binding transcriptional MerR regulator [Saccharothrix violaceirubra]